MESPPDRSAQEKLVMYKYLIENESFGEVLSNSKNKRIRKLIKWLEMRTT